MKCDAADEEKVPQQHEAASMAREAAGSPIPQSLLRTGARRASMSNENDTIPAEEEPAGIARQNAAQIRLRLFLVAIMAWFVTGAFPFILALIALKRESIVAVSELTGCTLSFFCCFIIFGTYFWGGRSFRRHPNKLLVYKTACDAGLCLVVVVAFVYLQSFRCEDTAHEADREECLARGYLHTCDHHKLIPFFTQLFAVSSESWFLILLIDLRRAVKNPFYSFDSSRPCYRACVWCSAAITATLLVACKAPKLYGLLYPPSKPDFDDDDDNSGDEGAGTFDDVSAFRLSGASWFHFRVGAPPYVLDYASCWIRDHSGWSSFEFSPKRKVPKWSLFYGPLVVVYTFAAHTLYVVKQRLARGLSSTFAARVRIAAVSVLTVLTYAAYWLLFALLVSAIYVLERTAEGSNKGTGARRRNYAAAFDVYTAWSFHRMTKCWWDLLVWLLANDPLLFKFAATDALAYCFDFSSHKPSRRTGNTRRLALSVTTEKSSSIGGVVRDDEADADLTAQSHSHRLSQPLLSHETSIQTGEDVSIRGDEYMLSEGMSGVQCRGAEHTDENASPPPRQESQHDRASHRRRRSERLHDDDDADPGNVDVDAPLRPQTNDALRKEMLYYVTSGIRQAARASATARTQPDDLDRPINLKRRDVGKETIHLSLAKLVALFFVDDDLGGVRRQRTASRNHRKEGDPVRFSSHVSTSGPGKSYDGDAIEERESNATSPRRPSAIDLPGALTVIDADETRLSWSGASRDSRATAPRYSSWSTHADDPRRDDLHSQSGDIEDPAHSLRVSHLQDADSQTTMHRPTTTTRRSIMPCSTGADGSIVGDAFSPTTGSQRGLPNRDFIEDARSTSGGCRRRGAKQAASAAAANYDSPTPGIVFVDYKPQTFRRIREHFGVRLEDYVGSFRSTQKERFTEGGSSDAFFFYSGDERYMVKTCTATEFFIFLAICKDYAAYVCDPANRGTFLVRLLGAHCLRLYETAFYFLVMANVLKVDGSEIAEVGNGMIESYLSPAFGMSSPPRPVAISQTRFDIKGSWINRTMKPPRPGQRLTCRHCNRKYIFAPKQESSWLARTARIYSRSRRRKPDTGPHATIRRTRNFEQSDRMPTLLRTSSSIAHSIRGLSSQDNVSDVVPAEPPVMPHDRLYQPSAYPYDETFCPVTVGGEHAPNLTLKDNDLNYSHRLRLEHNEAAEVVRQLQADARLLASLGIMDYSLLLGIRSVEYPAPQDDSDYVQNTNHSVSGTGVPGNFGEHTIEEGAAGDMPELECRASLLTSLHTPDAARNESAETQSHVRNTPSHSASCCRRSHVVVRHFYYFGAAFGFKNITDSFAPGVIDILQRWTLQKRLELWWKVHVRRFDREGISCLPPERYCARFQAKMAELLLPNRRTGGFP